MQMREFQAAANAIALAAWKLMVTVEHHGDGVPDDVAAYAAELRAVSAEWCPRLPPPVEPYAY